MTHVRYVHMLERHPTGIGRQNAEFVGRMTPRLDLRTHRLRHWEVNVRGRPRLGYVSMLTNRLVPLRRMEDEILHAGDSSLVPLFSDPFDIVEIWDTMPFERLDLYQRDLVSAFHAGSTVPGVLRAEQIVVHSPSTRADVRSFFGRESTVIPAGVDTGFFDIDPVIQKEPRSVLAVAAYYPQKNLENLVRGCGEAGTSVLRLIGRQRDDNLVRSLRNIANGYPDMTFRPMGYVDPGTLRAEYNRAAVYASASTREGFGVTPVEAMACGTLPVLSDIPTHRDTAGTIGLFFDPLDPTDIGDAIAKGFDVRERDILRMVALQFSWDSVVRTWSDLYRSFGVNVIYGDVGTRMDGRKTIDAFVRAVRGE